MASPIRYGTPNIEMLGTWIARPPEQDGPFWAVNLMKYRAVAEYADGRDTSVSGKEADDAYAPTDELADIGAMVAFFADVEQQSGSAPEWERVGIVRYPSRASFMAMQQRADFQTKHAHKDAGMERTIVLACLPDAGEVPAGAEGAVIMRVARVRTGASLPPIPGATRLATFAVEGVIIGDDRDWSAVAFDVVPAERGTAEFPGGEAGVDEQFVMTVRPTIDALVESLTT